VTRKKLLEDFIVAITKAILMDWKTYVCI